MLDLHATIEPGRSAAGFKIGQLFSSIEPFLESVLRVTYKPGLDVLALHRANTGALVMEGFGRPGVGITFGDDVVRLAFSSDGRLGCIHVFEGKYKGSSYTGSYRGVRIGQPLSTLTEVDTYEFDSGDEMYYRVGADGEYVPGLAVVAVEEDVAAHGSIPIVGYCVHDWSVFRSSLGQH